MSNLHDVLETCLQEIENGTEIETVLFRYPELAEELRPILEASRQAKRIQVPDPSAESLRRNRARLLQHAAQLREARAQPSRRLWSVPLRRVMVTLAVIAALFIGSTNLVRAASTTLPGDNLYPVKRTWEDVLVLLTFNIQARTALEVAHENERLEELYELFAEERSVRVDFAGLVTHQNGDLWLVSKIPIVISAQTDIRDQPIGVGDAIRVRGTTQADGTVLAERVELLDADKPLPDVDDEDDAPEIEQENNGNENEDDEDNSGRGSEGEAPDPQQTAVPEGESEPEEISLEGVVSSVNGTIVIVNGVTMDISNAEIRGAPAAGADVKVEGYYGSDSVFIVTRIEFFSNDSNSVDNGDSNDNGSDDNSGSSNSDDDDNSNSDDNSGSGHSGGDDSNDNGGDDGGDD